MSRNHLFFVFFLIIQFSLVSCGQKKGKNSENDKLFLGFYLGMPQKDFFDHCTELNKQQLITQGPGGSTNVEHLIKNQFSSEVSMRFFPTFIDQRIFEMPVTYAFISWAPWNKQFWADQLLDEVLTEYKKTYGNDFKLLNHPTQGKVYYKIDGKRRINLFVKDEQFVQAVFTDLKVEKRLKEEYAKKIAPDYN
jgi:hypothetical protein